jgi:hypothetical protein
LYVLNDVQDGAFDEMPVSLGFLKARFDKKPIPKPPVAAGWYKP